MPIWAQGDLTLFRHEDFALGVDRGHETLAEEMDALLFQPEVIVSLEEGNGFLVIEDRSHEIPGDRATVNPAGGEDFFGEDLKERFTQNGGDAVSALGSIKNAESRSWPPATVKAATRPVQSTPSPLRTASRHRLALASSR